MVDISLTTRVNATPLILLCFSEFPARFLLAGLLMVPLISNVVCTAITLLMLAPFPVLCAKFSIMIESLIS